MEDSEFAAYANALSMKSYEQYLSCQIVAIPPKYFPFQMGYTIQKNSPFFDAFRYYITQMKESGEVDKIRVSYKGKEQVCPTYEGKPLALRQCISGFGIILLGITLSLVWLRYATKVCYDIFRYLFTCICHRRKNLQGFIINER